MDLEQRIGRIHRYGQRDTAQVYSLVAKDTIEGSIYLLLEEKLQDIAKTLDKIDEQGLELVFNLVHWRDEGAGLTNSLILGIADYPTAQEVDPNVRQCLVLD